MKNRTSQLQVVAFCLFALGGWSSEALAQSETVAQTEALAEAETDAAGDRRPVLLRRTLLLPPYESTGTGLAPEVKLKVELDRRGAPGAVEVLSVKPSSDLDAAFRRHTIEQINTWRWAPAIENGEAVPTTLSWTVQYVVNEGSFFADGSQRPTSVRYEERFRRLEHLRSQSIDKKKEILERYAEIAEQFVDRDRRRHFVSPRFIVVTDAEEVDTARIVAGNLEASLGAVSEMHQPEIEPLPHGLKTLVYLYSSKGAFEAARRELLPLTLDLATYYSPGLILYHLEVPSGEALVSFLVHEASHAYSDHHLRRTTAMPLWFEEGFAEYMGNSRVRKGKLEPGRVQTRQYVLDNNHYGGGVRLATTVAGWDLKTVKRLARKGEAMTLRQLFDAERAEFYGADFAIHYGTAWLFTHFLRHGREEWQDGRFSELVLYLSEGYDDEQALKTVYGLTLAEFEEPFVEYVKDF